MAFELRDQSSIPQMNAPDNDLRPPRQPDATVARKLRFGIFEIDLTERELRKRGIRVKLQEKPFQVLEALLRARGRLVTRKQLADALWPGLHVSFDQNLNTAMNALRQVLGDSSKSSHFIETRPGLGYRFIGTVQEIANSRPDSGDGASGELTKSETYHDYLRGRHFCERLNEDDLRKGIAHFESAQEQGPEKALAFSGAADAYMTLAALTAVRPADVAPKIKSLIDTALELGPQLAEPHVSSAAFKRMFQCDWKNAQAEITAAVELNPNCGFAHREMANLFSASGQAGAALNSMRRAHQIDPLSLAANTDLAWTLFLAGDARGALEQCWKTLTLEPRLAAAQHILALAYEQIPMFDDAIAELENARQCWDENPAAVAALVHVHGAAGRPDDAERTFQELITLSNTRYVSPYYFSLASLGLGQNQRALDYLEEAIEIQDVGLAWAYVEPRVPVLDPAVSPPGY
jgi:DNA-binding winged helix-turn-helix (wHTH) protein/Tfp pilus assembly protein PilF